LVQQGSKNVQDVGSVKYEDWGKIGKSMKIAWSEHNVKTG